MFDNISEKQVELLFKKLLSKEENSKCADCKQKGATWASLGFGVFVCITCSGIHRSFGMHITRVRSTKLDSWTKADAKIMEMVGNEIANAFWEYKIHHHKKEKLSFENDKRSFVLNKYDLKLYAKEGVKSPVDFILQNHYNVTSQALKNLYKEEQAEPKSEKKNKAKGEAFGFIRKPEKKEEFQFDFLENVEEEVKKNQKEAKK